MSASILFVRLWKYIFYKHWVTIRFRKSMENKGNLSLSKIRLVSEKAFGKLS